MVDGVRFEPVLQLSEQLHPHVFSFLAILDVPLYHRLDNRTLSPTSYYIDEQILLQMLKPSTTTGRSIHALDSVRYIRDCLCMDIDDTNADVTHWSQVSRDILFHNVHQDDVTVWTNSWRLTGRKITILSLAVFRCYVIDLELALRRSVDKLVQRTINATIRQRRCVVGDAPTPTGDGLLALSHTNQETIITSDLQSTRLLDLSAYPSFDTWWTEQSKSSLFLNFDASSLGVALSWLFVLTSEVGIQTTSLQYLSGDTIEEEAANIQAEWQGLRRAYANEIKEMECSFTQGTLWTTGSSEEQQEARTNGLECFRCWFDSTVIAAAQHHFNPRPEPWTPDDGSPAAEPKVRRKV